MYRPAVAAGDGPHSSTPGLRRRPASPRGYIVRHSILSEYAYVCMYVYIYIYMLLLIHYIYIYTYICAYMYICIYTYVYGYGRFPIY